MRRIIALCLGLFTLTPAEAEMYKGTETPVFTVQGTFEGAELRSYGPRVTAEVTVGGSRSGAASAGFRILASYIFGGNAGSAKIAMTAPVAQLPDDAANGNFGPATSPGARQNWTVRFTMPAQYTLSTLPAPDDPRIRLLQTAPGRMLVLEFSGWPTDAALAEQRARLLSIADQAGLTPAGAPEFLFYDSPFTLPWNRRNEVALPVE